MTESKIELQIIGVTCASCVSKIESTLLNLDGVNRAEMNFATRTVVVEGNVEKSLLINAIEEIGYKASQGISFDEPDTLGEKEQAELVYYKRLIHNMVIALSLGVPLMLYGVAGGEMTVSTITSRVIWFVVGLLTLAVMLHSGKHFYVGAWNLFKNHSASMDTLIAVGTGTAWAYSMMVVIIPDFFPALARHIYFEASAMIIGLINLGLALEAKARGRTSEAIKRLIGLQAKTARLVHNNTEVDVPISEVKIDDLIRIRPGEKVPVDAEVIDGHTSIDESMLTGEPIPIEKICGDKISTGSLNKTGSIIAKATGIGENTALAQIISMVKQAQNSKPPIGHIADHISAYFVPSVLIIAIISALVWLNVGPAPSYAFAMVAATTVLIIACPCALGLATPMSVMVGVGKAAESGVLIRNGEALQTASKITTMVLDKTGTITLGTPKVTELIPVESEDENNLLLLAAAVEKNSEHPLAQAILDEAKDRYLDLIESDNFHVISGMGVEAWVSKKKVLFGNKKLMHENNISLNLDSGEDYIALSEKLASEAKTPMFLAVDDQLKGIIAVSDPIKEDSISAIKNLKNLGVRIVMLTGDNHLTANAVAEKVGITEYVAEVLPENKADKVKALQLSGEIVGMTGDGINDAPALALADVGFAVGTGTDVAIESADVTLMRGSLHGLVYAISISKATLRNIKQNLFGAFIYNICGIPFAAGVLYPAFGILLSPIIAGAAMAFSSVTVVSNANRLRLFQPS